MPIQPWLVTQTSPAWTITLSVPNNPNAPDLTGLTVASLALVVVNKGTAAISSGQGVFTSINSFINPAVVVYQPDDVDLFVLNADFWRLYIQVNYANGPDLFGPYTFVSTSL